MSDSTLVKLILLFAMDKMEVPLEEDVLTDLCCNDHDWLNYMDCKDAIWDLESVDFIHKRTVGGKIIYSITPDGRMCLANFYTRIPTSLRAEISDTIKKDRINYRRKQEYVSDYFKNSDGTYTVVLKILNPSGEQPLFELKIIVESREHAAYVYKNWEQRASTVYNAISSNLLDV